MRPVFDFAGYDRQHLRVLAFLPVQLLVLSVCPHLAGNEVVLPRLRPSSVHKAGRCFRLDLLDLDSVLFFQLLQLLVHVLDVFVLGYELVLLCNVLRDHFFLDLPPLFFS